MNEIKRSKLEWASYVWRKFNSMIKIVILGNLKCKRPLGLDYVGKIALERICQIPFEKNKKPESERDSRN